MRNKVCTAYAKMEIVQSVLIGPVALISGIFIAKLTISNSILDFFVLHFGQNLAYIFVILYLIFSGSYLLFSGLRKLCNWGAADICRYIHAELPPERGSLTGKEMLALVDSDLERAAVFGSEKILIGQEWLFVQNAWGKPIILLKNIRRIKENKTKNAQIILKFMDQRGIGPVTRELSAAEANAIKGYLQINVPNLEI